MNYKIKKVADRIYLVEFKKAYDLAMFFCRYQEFYESPNPDFKGKAFDLYEFMAWYADEYGNGVFTYPEDWCGFNLPSHIIDQVWRLGIPGKTQYDYEMLLLHKKLKEEAGTDYCLIGTSKVNKSDKETIAHEVAHALYYINDDYRMDMDRLVSDLSKEKKKILYKCLFDLGYCENVIIDEIQAYLSTGLTDILKRNLKKYSNIRNPFKKCFKHYLSSLDIVL